MAFNLDAALRISSVTIAKDVESKLSSMGQSVNFNVTGLTGANESLRTFNTRVTTSVSHLNKLQKTAESVSVNIVKSFDSAAAAVDKLIAKMGEAKGASLGPAIGGAKAGAPNMSWLTDLKAQIAATNQAIQKAGKLVVDAGKIAGPTGKKPQVAVTSGENWGQVPTIAGFAAGKGKGITADTGTVPVVQGFGKATKAAQALAKAVAETTQALQQMGTSGQQAGDKVAEGMAAPNAMLGQFPRGGGKNRPLKGRGTPQAPPPATYDPMLGQFPESGGGRKPPRRGQGTPQPAPEPAYNPILGQFPESSGRPRPRRVAGTPTPPTPPVYDPMLGQFAPGGGAPRRPGATPGFGGAMPSRQVTTQLSASARAAADFADAMLLAGRRYAAFILATSVPFVALAALRKGAQDVIAFDAALVKLDQTLDPTSRELGSVKRQIIDLSVATGTSAESLSQAAVMLAQAGFSGERLRASLETLAQVPLLPSFDGIEQATEGLIAIMGQFKTSADEIPGVFDKLNEVSNRYAVTSADLIEATKRGGGTFAALGGDIDEYIAFVTAARQTTQESAEAIGTGLRTIFARIGRPETLEYLRSLGVTVSDSKGEILSLYRIMEQTAKVFQGSDEIKKRDIAEQLGGLRQVGRVIAVLNNFGLVEEVLRTSQTSAGSVAKDAEKGLASLAKQLDVAKAKANELVQALAPGLFKPIIEFFINGASSALAFAKALSPVITALTVLGGAALLKQGLGVGALLAGRLSTAGATAPAAAAGMWGVPATGVGASATGIGTVMAARFAMGRQHGLEAAGKNLGLGEGQTAVTPSVMGNQFVQLGIVTAVVGAMGALEDEMKETGHSTAALGAQFVKTAAVLVGVASVLKGQSVSQMGRGALGYFRGAGPNAASGMVRGLVGAGAVGLAAGVLAGAGARQVEEAIATKVEETAQAIRDIPVPDAKKDGDIQRAHDDVLGRITATIDDSAAMYDGILGKATEFGRRWNLFWDGLLSMDFRKIGQAFNPNNPSVDAEGIMKELLAENKAIAQAVLEASVSKSGVHYEKTLVEMGAARFRELNRGRPQDLAQLSTKHWIDAAGGAQAVTQTMKKVAEDIRTSNMAEEAKRAAKSLAQLIIPPNLSGQLLTLSKAVDAATKSVQASIEAYDGANAAVSSVSAPNIQTSVEPRAAQVAAAQGTTGGALAKSPDLQKFAQTYEQMTQWAEQFVVAIGNAQQDAEKFNRNLAPGTKRAEEPLRIGRAEGEETDESQAKVNSDALDRRIDEFLNANEVPAKLRDSLRRVLRLIGEAMSEASDLRAAGIDSDALKKIYQDAMKNLMPINNEIVDLVAKDIEMRMAITQKRLELFADQTNRRIQTPQSAESQYPVTKEALAQAGIAVPEKTGTTSDLMTNMNDILRQMDQNSTRVYSELAEAMRMWNEYRKTGETRDAQGRPQTYEQVEARYAEASKQAITLRAAMEAFSKSLGQYEQWIGERAQKQEEARSIYNELVTEQSLLQEVQRNIAGRSDPAAKRQEEYNRLVLGEIKNVIEKASKVAEMPPENNKQAARELAEAMNQYRARMIEYHQQLVKFNQPDVDKSGLGRVTETLRESLDKIKELAQQISETNVGLKNEDIADAVRAAGEALSQIEAKNQKTIAEGTILKDPTAVFDSAVKRFEEAVKQFALREEQTPPPPQFETKGGQTKAVSERFNPQQKEALQRAALGGMTEQEIRDRADAFLRSKESPQKWKGDLYSGGYGARANGQYVPMATSVAEANTLDPDTRKKLADAYIGKLKTERPQNAIDADTESRIRQVFYGGKVENMPVTPAMQSDYEARETLRKAQEEREALRNKQSAATRPADADLDLYSMQIPSVLPARPSVPARETAPPTDQAPAKPTTSGPSADAGTVQEGIKGLGERIVSAITGAFTDSLGKFKLPDPAAFGDVLAQAAKQVASKSDTLASSLDGTAKALAQGLDMKLDAVQQLDVKISGLDEAIASELKPAIEEVASRAAKKIVYDALQDLANRSDGEGARTFRGAASTISADQEA